LALSIDILNFCVSYGHCKKEIHVAFHTLVGQDGGEKETEGKRENMSISIPNTQTKYPTPCDQILVNPRPEVKSRFLSEVLRFPTFFHHILAKSWIPKIPFQTLKQLRQRCKASENTQGTNCIALFFAVISVHWQHELAQSLLLSCL